MFVKREEPCPPPNLLRATGVSEAGKLVVALSMLSISSGNCLERRKLAGLVTKTETLRPWLVVPDSWR